MRKRGGRIARKPVKGIALVIPEAPDAARGRKANPGAGKAQSRVKGGLTPPKPKRPTI